MTRLEQVTAELRRVLALAEAPEILWQDKIQEDAPLWGFDQIRTQFGAPDVLPSDANGANVSRVPDPDGGFCLRLYGDARLPGAYVRAHAGVWLWKYPELTKAVDDGCYFEQEVYIPKVLNAKGNPYSWRAFYDIHVMDEDHTNRSYHGLQVAQDGSMLARLAWGGPLYAVNRDFGTPPPTSKIPLPVGRWFKIKTYFKRSVEPTTVRVWFDDELALEWVGVINSLPSNVFTEWYGPKIYAGVQIPPKGEASPWGEMEERVRNIRMSV